MPPKKVANKREPKLVKPPRKIPSKITVKIGSTGDKPPKTEKSISCERKIELANEVALAQLQAQSATGKSHKPAALPTTQANNTKDTVKKSIKKFTTVATDGDSLEDFETTPEPNKKKRPGPKSLTMPQTKKTPNLNPLVLVRNNQWEVKGKIAEPITKVKNTPKRKKQKSVAVNLDEVLCEAETGAAQACMNITATPPTKPRGRPKGSVTRPKKTPAMNKTLSAKEIKAAASMLEHALGIGSLPQSRSNSVISNRSNLSWTRDISTESSLTSGTTCITATSNDFVRFDNKLPLVQVENCAPPKVINVTSTPLPQSILPKVNSVTTHRPPSSVLSNDESTSSDSESSSSSSSSSDSELGGANTLPELNLSTSSLTSRLPISVTNIGRHIEIIKNVLKNFHSDIRKYVSHDNDDLCTYSEIYECVDRELNAIRPVQKSVVPDFDATIDKCDNFDRDLEAMVQGTYSSEKSVEHQRIAGFTEQNESENQEEIEDSPRPNYECNHSESGCPENNVHKDSEAIFAKPDLVTRVSAADSRDTSTNLPDEQLVSNINRVEASPTDSFKTFTSDSYNYLPFDRSDDDGENDRDGDDDDDALSLYAGSISGLESSRLDPVAFVSPRPEEVYVPKNSPTSGMREKYIYRPNKIQVHKSNLAEESIEEGEIISNKDDQEQEPGTKPTILQTCVSSSGSKDKKMKEDSNHLSSQAEESIKWTEAQVKWTEAQVSSQPQRLFSSYTAMNPIRSSLYRGFCFFSIASQCKRSICRFPHIIIGDNTFKHRLTLLNQENLIAEYLLMCGYVSLKRRYCISFVEECKRRTATKILLEMAIDLGLGIVEIDEDLRVKALETTLLHLNTISLDECDDLLKFEHNDTMLCDALLSCMANSQNFAQFKGAFVKLANLMSELNRPVDFQVASSILERVCILPGEDFLARGMLTLMENTDVSIFDSSLAESFEVQLSNIDSDVHAVYLLAKKSAIEGLRAELKEMHPASPPSMPREELRHTSPDTTNVDELPQNNEPVFKRTINDEALRNLFKPPSYPVQKRFVLPRLSQSSSRYRHNAKRPYRRIAHQTPGGRWVVGSQMVCRNMTRK